MSYVSKQQLIDRYGEDKLAQLTDRDDGSDIDDVVLNEAIADADKTINAYVSPRYTLPLDHALIDTSPLPLIAGAIVLYELQEDIASEQAEKRYDKAMKFLRDIQMNKASLGEQDTDVATPEGTVKTGQGESSNFDWEIY